MGVYTAANEEWALDFVHDVVASGRTIRVLNVIDAYTRESLTNLRESVIDSESIPPNTWLFNRRSIVRSKAG